MTDDPDISLPPSPTDGLQKNPNFNAARRAPSARERELELELASLRDDLTTTRAALSQFTEQYNSPPPVLGHVHGPYAATLSSSTSFALPATEPEEAEEEPTLMGQIAREVGNRVARGVKAELSAQAKTQVIKGARALVPSLPEGPGYDAILALVIPMALIALGHAAADYVDDEEFTGKLLAGVTEGAGLALEGVSKDAVKVAVTEALPAFRALAAVARPELAAGSTE